MQVLLPELGITASSPHVLPQPVPPRALESSSFFCLQLPGVPSKSIHALAFILGGLLDSWEPALVHQIFTNP